MSKNLSPQNKITKKDLTELIRGLAQNQQAHANALAQVSQICFILAEFVGGRIGGCHTCGHYVITDIGSTKCPKCDSELQLGPEVPDAQEEANSDTEGEGAQPGPDAGPSIVLPGGRG